MFDILIKNANIIDGSGKDRYIGDIGITGKKIRKIGSINETDAKNVIDANYRFVTPGFVDIHRHGDSALLRKDFGMAEIYQGITTIVNGNCGLSVSPVMEYHEDIKNYLYPITGDISDEFLCSSIKEYLDNISKMSLPLNVGMLVGSGTARTTLFSYHKEKLSDDECKMLGLLLKKSYDEGALSVSMGIEYEPECFYTTDEIMKVLSVFSHSDAVVTVHMRYEGTKVLDSIREMIEISKELDIHIHISHLKAIGKSNWNDKIPKALKYISDARENGIKIDCDFYPYEAGSTQLIHILPPEFIVGSVEDIVDRLSNRDNRKVLQERIEKGTDFDNIAKLVTWNKIYVSGVSTQKNQKYVGMNIFDIGKDMNVSPLDACCDLLVDEKCKVTMVDFIASEDDIEKIMSEDYSNIISDSTYPMSDMVHPRVYGTFSRVLERYVKEKGIISIEKAVKKMSKKPCEVLSIKNKGEIRENYDADLLIFDLDNIKENASYENPRLLSSGIDYVLIGGEIVLKNGEIIKTDAGEVIRHDKVSS